MKHTVGLLIFTLGCGASHSPPTKSPSYGDHAFTSGDSTQGDTRVAIGDTRTATGDTRIATGGDTHTATGTWICFPSYQGGGDGCDCGCGAPDPDCAGQANCWEVGCQLVACDYCWSGYEVSIMCDASVGGWTCDPYYHGAHGICDCGCGALDSDCGGGGCTEPDCSDIMCDRCWDASTEEVECW